MTYLQRSIRRVIAQRQARGREDAARRAAPMETMAAGIGMTSAQIMENWRREQEPPSEVQGPDDPRGVWLAAPFGLFAALQVALSTPWRDLSWLGWGFMVIVVVAVAYLSGALIACAYAWSAQQGVPRRFALALVGVLAILVGTLALPLLVALVLGTIEFWLVGP